MKSEASRLDKCKIVADNGTTIHVVENCTDAAINGNPYAESPSETIGDHPIDYENEGDENATDNDNNDTDDYNDEIQRVARSHTHRQRLRAIKRKERHRPKHAPRRIRIVYDDVGQNDYE